MAEDKTQDAARPHKEASDFAQSGKAEAAPKNARKTLDGAEGDAMRQAKQDDKHHNLGENPPRKR